jgi:DNA-directed RNA polymerase beta' subunit
MVQDYNLQYVRQLMQQGQVQFVQKAGLANARHISFMAEQTLTLQLGDCLLRGGRKFRIVDGTPAIPHTTQSLPICLTTIDNSINLRMCVGDRIMRQPGHVIDPCKHIIWPEVAPGDLLLITPQRGDWVLDNRQPTLVEESMSAMRIVPLPIQSFAFNCAAVEALRGDYDGDEINIHFPQTPQTVAELRHIMALEKQIVTAQGSKPVVKLIHDSVVTAYYLTRKVGHRTYKRPYCLPRQKWQQLCASLPLSIGDIVTRTAELQRSYEYLCVTEPSCYAVAAMTWEEYRYSGMALISMLLPVSMYFHQKSEHTTLMGIYLQRNRVPKDQQFVHIFRGLLYGGVLDTSLLNGKHSILHHLFINHGSKAAGHFLTCMQILTANATMTLYSLSINLDDCRLPQKFLVECNVARKLAIQQALSDEQGETIRTAHLQSVTLFLDKLISIQRVNEERIVRMLSANRASDEMPNHMLLLTILGSKGSISNIIQTTYCLGQQVIQGARIEPEWNGRYFPHAFGDISDTAQLRLRGLVYSRNFYMGLSPLDFFVHAMAGREALVEGATSTAQSGYAMRLAMKLLEHNTTQYDMTVRNQYNKIIQFLYAGDGFDRRFACGNQPLDSLAQVDAVLHNMLYI